jgi:3-deoxy-manno-octulosonate cytidylyltransferase (CMP-KDO synthetase)
MRSVIVIPARYGSSRFPGKLLAPISGKTLIRRVWERVAKSELATSIWIATDDERIADHVESFGGLFAMTPSSAPTGTDRIAAALKTISRAEGAEPDQIINVQGDEPLIEVEAVDRMIAVLQNEESDVVTLACPIRNESEMKERNVVKVVTNLVGEALYFSRAAIPYGDLSLARRHIGVYGFQRRVLEEFTSLPQTPLEKSESLEQLRLLENGFTIRVIETARPHLGVDHPDDIPLVEAALRQMGID